MYESKGEPLLPARHFVFRMLLHLLFAALVTVLAVFIGVVAHLWLEDISWHDAVLNTALIISGIGPFILPATVAGKIFFALYSILVGLLFVGALGLILAPVAHRLIHKFHLDEGNDPESKPPVPPSGLRQRYVISHQGGRTAVEVDGMPVPYVVGANVAFEPQALPRLDLTLRAWESEIAFDDARLAVHATDLSEPVARALYEHLQARFQQEHDEAARLYPQAMET